MLNTTVGVTLAAVAAAVAVAVVPRSGDRAVLPLVFLAVVITLSLRFGEGAGILGTLVGAGIFAYFLFSPIGSFKIGNEAARTNISWLLLVGISASFLLAPSSTRKHPHDHFDKHHSA